MQLVIAAIGKMRDETQTAMLRSYVARAEATGKHLGFSGPVVKEAEPPKNLPIGKRTSQEAALLSAAMPEKSISLILDERGKDFTSEQLAEWLRNWRDDGVHAATFMIGGADGHDKSVKRTADKVISFGAATWPHMLVRIMLAEQIYRAMTILSGHPYHRS